MLNILDIFFLNLAFSVTLTGWLIINFEKHLPTFVIKSFKYGSFAYKGSGAEFLQLIEIPKSYYRHFYLFSSVFATVTLMYMVLVYYLKFSVNYYISLMLRIILQNDEPSVSSTAATLAMFLLSLQCIKRFYETHYLQVFAKSSKINLSHYLAGLVHYFGCVVAIVGEAPLFCGTQTKNLAWSERRTTYYAVPFITIFLWACYEQYKTNIIFANLRKHSKSGKVITEEHKVPNGRWFESVSSPHRMCEVIMYTVLVCLVPTKTFFCIYLWVLSNQIQTAIQAHEWYKKTFKDYPNTRAAIFPGML